MKWKTNIITMTLFLAGSASAGTTGKLVGKVIDEQTGDPLVGCNVVLARTSMGAATDENGQYLVLGVPPNTYDVKASMIGYAAITVQNVTINIDLTTTIDFALTSEALGGEEITVVAERSAVQMDLTSSEARVSAEQLETLPVTEIWDVISIQSGITKDAGGGIHIRGGRSSEVAYWVDGIPVTDVYDGGLAVAVENNAIQELQVISGTFNAEYGQAMSGIINMVTKDGGQNYSGSFTGYSGGYQSTDPLYRNLDNLDMGNEKNLQFSLSGPVPLLGKFLTFYFTGRQNKTNGFLNGLRTFTMYGDTLQNPEVVSMNWRDKTSTNSKLTFHLSNKLKLRLGILTSDETYRDYSHYLQLSPDGRSFNFSRGRDYKLNLTHTLSSRSFYTFSLSQFEHEYERYRFESSTNSSYIDPYYYDHIQAITPIYSFGLWGIDTGRFKRKSTTKLAKFDLTTQLNPVHQVKFGGEARKHKLTLDSYALRDSSENDEVFTIEIPEPDSFNRSQYSVQPGEFSLYIQDKIEFKSVILNIGVRWDWFSANGEIPANPAEPYIGNPRNPAVDSLLTLSDSLYGDDRLLEDIEWSEYADHYAHLLSDSGASLINATGWWTKTTPKQLISPRFGIAYPITDQGVIHFSFGHFFQIPEFRRLFDNPGYKIPETSGSFGIYPNADLKPQRTVMYELGLRQTFMEDITIDITGFYRDVRDWVSTGIPVDLGGGASYFTYVNKDYSNVRGVTVSLEKQYSNFWAMNLNYTFQVAEGSNSDPGDEFGAVQANREPPRSIIPLDWDQAHTINGNVYVGSGPWGVTLLGRYGSGYPYTPQIVVSSIQGATLTTQLVNNSRRKPSTFTLDLKGTYTLSLAGVSIKFFASVYNLLDRRNENVVWGDTGRANKTLTEPTGEELVAYEGDERPNTIAEYFTHPEWYHPPRQIQVGLSISF